MTRSSFNRAGLDLKKVSSIHASLAHQLGATSILRAGKKGAPLIPIGHYAGLIDLGGRSALALHTDGVGSKVLIAQQLRKFDTVGIDCVAMTANDLICLGAEPVALLDYIALERENEPLVSEICKGLAEGARLASTAIVGGETAILGDMVRGIGGNGFDLVSMGAGLVDKRAVVDGARICEGDMVLGVESSGLHSNGFTLARKTLRNYDLNEHADGLKSTVGEALLTPTRIYVRPTLKAIGVSDIHGIGHITGGAFSKLMRLVGERRLKFDLFLPPSPPIFRLLQTEGRLPDSVMYRNFNMGIGLCLVLPESRLDTTARVYRREGFKAHEIGRVRRGWGVVVNGTTVG